jgi:hypothetical protein
MHGIRSCGWKNVDDCILTFLDSLDAASVTNAALHTGWYAETDAVRNQMFQLHRVAKKNCGSPRRCVHPGCQDKAIKSHAISKSALRVLSAGQTRISRIDFDIFQQTMISLGKGPSDASTFLGFCKTHDNDLFESFEKAEFVNAAPQILDAAYRAVGREIRSKLDVIIEAATLMHEVSQNEKKYDAVNPEFYLRYLFLTVNMLLSLKQVVALRDVVLESIRNNTTPLVTAVFTSPEPLVLASWGVSSLAFDFAGRSLPVRGQTDFLDSVFVSTHINEGGVQYVVSWLRDSPTGAQLAESLRSLSHGGMATNLPGFLISACEVTYLANHRVDEARLKYSQLVLEAASGAIERGLTVPLTGLTDFAVSRLQMLGES